jgi:hypothetical protein
MSLLRSCALRTLGAALALNAGRRRKGAERRVARNGWTEARVGW